MTTHKMTAEKDEKKGKGADVTPTGVKRAKPYDATQPPPHGKDGVDLAKLKEARREKPDEAPALPGPTGTGRPAKIHPAPHLPGVPHEPGQDPEEAAEEAKEAGAPDVETPFPDQQAQTLYGLRKEGRLFRCRLAGYATILVEADDANQAREAALCEFRRVAGEDDPKRGKKKAEKVEKGAGLPAMPVGFAAVPVGMLDPSLAKAPVEAANISVVKLAP